MRAAGGFTYVVVLFWVGVFGFGLASTATVWHRVQQRDKEAQLLFVGDQFRRAIGDFYERSPGTDRRYPRNLEELLLDPRQPGVVRYLRRIYVDPMTAAAQWGLVSAPDGQIVGVYSLSEHEPIRRHGFPAGAESFGSARRYSEWKFIYTGGQAVSAAPAPGAPEAMLEPPEEAGARLALGTPQPLPAGDAPPNPCYAQRTADQAACEVLRAAGEAGTASACSGSAQLRLSACLRGTPLPALRTSQATQPR